MKNTKTVFWILAMAVILMAQNVAAQDDSSAPRKLKSVSITFDESQAKARRKLTRAEKLRRDANLRSQRRLQADYNQPIPF